MCHSHIEQRVNTAFVRHRFGYRVESGLIRRIGSSAEGVPEALDKLLKRSSAIRDPLSDAHGKDPGEGVVPAEIVDLAIHWTGAFIVYLSEAASE